MGVPISFDLTTDNKDLLRTIEQLQKKVDTLQGKMSNLGGRSAGGLERVGGELKNIATSLIGPLGVAAGVVALVRTVKSAYADMIAEHRKFLGHVESASEARARMLWNVKGGPGEKEVAEQMARDVARKGGVTPNRAYAIMATALSARGDASDETMLSAATTAARLERMGVGQGDEIVGAALDVARVTGLTDADANMAYLKQIGMSSRATSLQAQMNLLPGLRAAVLAGDDAESAGEMVAAINVAMGDVEGRQTGTGVTNLVNKLRSEKLVNGRALQGNTTAERVANLQEAYTQASDDERYQILQKIGGEQKMRPIIQQMLENNPQWQSTLAAMQERITPAGSAESVGEMHGFLASMETGDDAIAGAAKQARAAIETDATLGRTEEAAAVAARDIAMGWVKQQGLQGSLLNATAQAAFGWNSLVSPEQYRNLAINATPEERRDTEAFRQLTDKLDQLVSIWIEANQAEAYAKLNEAAASLHETARVTREGGPPARPQSQEID